MEGIKPFLKKPQPIDIADAPFLFYSHTRSSVPPTPVFRALDSLTYTHTQHSIRTKILMHR